MGMTARGQDLICNGEQSWGGILGIGGRTHAAHPGGAHTIVNLGPLEPVSALLTPLGPCRGEHHSDGLQMRTPSPIKEGGGQVRL